MVNTIRDTICGRPCANFRIEECQIFVCIFHHATVFVTDIHILDHLTTQGTVIVFLRQCPNPSNQIEILLTVTINVVLGT